MVVLFKKAYIPPNRHELLWVKDLCYYVTERSLKALGCFTSAHTFKV